MDGSSTLPFFGVFVYFAFAGGYLLGSVPFGLLLTRMAGLGDIRAIGSGNIGTTNVLRTGRKDIAALTLLLDALKATAAIWAAWYWGLRVSPEFADSAAISAALGAFVGHLYPVWLKFKGGKGVATYLGVLIGLFWPAAVCFAVLWVGTARLTRFSSLAGMMASTLSPFFMFVMHQSAYAAAAFIMTVLVIFQHRQNIVRLLTGKETRIGEKKSPSAAEE